MPVTAKLSREFYEKLGDNLANELVDWFNDVDAAYRSELRDLNELNYARFEAKIDQRISDLRGELRAEMASLKADLIKWMFLFWAGTTFTVIGTLVALLKLF